VCFLPLYSWNPNRLQHQAQEGKGEEEGAEHQAVPAQPVVEEEEAEHQALQAQPVVEEDLQEEEELQEASSQV
jgi:hypothetical protein